jgi:hypothetical protein
VIVKDLGAGTSSNSGVANSNASKGKVDDNN